MSFAQRKTPILINELVVKSQPLMDISPQKMDDGKNAYYGAQYTEMMFAVEYMIHHKKIKVIKQIIDEMRKGISFRKALENNTQINVDSFHSFFDSDIQSLQAVEELLKNEEYGSAKNQIIDTFEDKGFYFNEAPMFLRYLVDIYIEKEYKKAEIYLVKLTEYMDSPFIYQELSNIALQYDKR